MHRLSTLSTGPLKYVMAADFPVKAESRGTGTTAPRFDQVCLESLTDDIGRILLVNSPFVNGNAR